MATNGANGKTASKTALAPAPANSWSQLPLGAHPGNTGGKPGRSGRKPNELRQALRDRADRWIELLDKKLEKGEALDPQDFKTCGDYIFRYGVGTSDDVNVRDRRVFTPEERAARVKELLAIAKARANGRT